MKKLVENILLIMLLTIAILFSYALIEKKISGRSSSEFINFIFSTQKKSSADTDSSTTNKNKQTKQYQATDMLNYKAVWLSYLEFNGYRKSIKNNNESSFRKFYEHILQRIKTLGFNRIIVQVRPFGDALYPSKYFPWAACISGKQGKNPGYDPLKIMTEMSHKEGIFIEAWINPYRISTDNSIRNLSKTNPARKWFSSQNTKRNVLSYDGNLYYNPSSENVRNLIIQGVQEIVQNYDVDGIHMDDYFYPEFTKDNVFTEFDAPEYQQQIRQSSNSSSSGDSFTTSDSENKQSLSLEDWRRDNVNQLVSGIYAAIKNIDTNVIFGISPAGNLDNLRSNLEYYVDVDTWIKQPGYVDYLIPQIYWGFTNKVAPFDKMVDKWTSLMKKSTVKLYIGLQLYRMGSTEPSQSDIKELQETNVIQKELSYLKKQTKVEGYCFFSYQYLDCQDKKYHFDTEQFSAKRKKLLNQIVKILMSKK